MGEREFYLRVVKGFEEGKTFPLTEDEITIGRAEENVISIRVAEVSRRHAVLNRQDEGYLLRDLGSTNGTFVDGKSLGGKYLLKPGDTIMLGDAVHLTFETEVDEVDPMEVTPPSPMEVPEPPPPPPPQAEVITPEAEKAPPAQEKPGPQEEKGIEEREALLEERGEGVFDEEEEGGGRTWLWAGIGCVVVLIFFVVVGLIAFDYLNLYCTPPFNTLFDFLYTCPS